MRTTFAKEDFLDFSYNDTWASEMGLIKVNTGKRQDDEILPASKDTTIDVPGSDGVYYLNSKFQQREFTINFAYDGLKEKDILAIREWLAPKKECQLIFSERPYKYYMAKPKSAPKLSYIAFDDTDGTRVYRGEGTVQFVCYYPWARSVGKYLIDYVDYFFSIKELCTISILNSATSKVTFKTLKGEEKTGTIDQYDYSIVVDEEKYQVYGARDKDGIYNYVEANTRPGLTTQQLEGSGITKLSPANEEGFKQPDAQKQLYEKTIVNVGQMPMSFKFCFSIKKDAASSKEYFCFQLQHQGGIVGQTWFRYSDFGEGDFLYDTEQHIIFRLSKLEFENNKPTYIIEESKGKAAILNSAIVAGDFFNIPQGESKFIIDDPINGVIRYGSMSAFLYDYLYY